MNWEKIPMTIPIATKNFMIFNRCPHHPSMHGVLRLIVALHGEDRYGKNCGKPKNYTISALCNTLGLISNNVNIPEQWKISKYLKEQLYKSNYVGVKSYTSHLLRLGPFMEDIGTKTPYFYIFRERELIYYLFEATTSMKMMYNYFRIGGVAANLPYGRIDKC
ncbi:NAD(P)H-quinone oxidoreductase subunit H chloroplastic [Bienertia sinuspersici]